ncbi:MAG: ROK family protein [Candidatus Saganbacteria bacterium]|nr:ROK family protein [Candidatus Saganbacteria bacterium]
MTKKYVIGVDLGGTKIAAGLATKTGKIINELEILTEAKEGHKEVINRIIESIYAVAGKKIKQVGKIGVGAPGTVDYKEGRVLYPPNLPGWKEINLRDLLKKEFHVPVYVDNDANCAALAEAKFGAGQNISNFVYVTISTGIGGGIVINKKIYRGTIGAAGEIGHISIQREGKTCSCGQIGHFEGLAAGGAINQQYGVSPIEVHEAAQRKKRWAFKIINELADTIGLGFANIVNILNPELIIVGGGISNMGELLLQPIRFALRKYALPLPYSSVKIVRAKLGTKAGLKGAIALCLK